VSRLSPEDEAEIRRDIEDGGRPSRADMTDVLRELSTVRADLAKLERVAEAARPIRDHLDRVTKAMFGRPLASLQIDGDQLRALREALDALEKRDG